MKRRSVRTRIHQLRRNAARRVPAAVLADLRSELSAATHNAAKAIERLTCTLGRDFDAGDPATLALSLQAIVTARDLIAESADLAACASHRLEIALALAKVPRLSA